MTGSPTRSYWLGKGLREDLREPLGYSASATASTSTTSTTAVGFIVPWTYKKLDSSQAIAICIMSVVEKADRLRSDARLQIKLCSDGLVQAAVRGDHGVYEVSWTR